MMTPQTDYDSPWKEILEHYFPDFLAFFFPQAHAEIDWARGYEFLDKELQRVVRDAEIGSRRVDKLVKVFLEDGRETWLLIHVEVQGQRDASFPRRMFVYHYRIFDRYRRQVVSLAVLTDDQPNWRPQRFGYERWGCRLTLDFPVVKLVDYEQRSDELVARDNPFALVVLAHLQTMRTRHRPGERYAAKLSLAKMLYRRGYSRADILQLFRFIDWVMTLPDELAQQFRTDIHEYEEEVKMQYVSSVERLAIKEGMEKGMEEGLQKGMAQAFRDNIVTILEVRFEAPAEDVATRLEMVTDVAALETLHRQALTADSFEAFVAYLDVQRAGE